MDREFIGRPKDWMRNVVPGVSFVNRGEHVQVSFDLEKVVRGRNGCTLGNEPWQVMA
jgi:hypothetical protein